MENFHQDITSEILSRVPFDSILNCKLVCKSWKSLLASKKAGLLFAIAPYGDRNAHLYYGDYNEITDEDNNDDANRDDDYSFYQTRTRKIHHSPINKDNRYCCLMVGSCNGLVCFSIPHHGINDPVYVCNPITREYINLPRLEGKPCTIAGGFGYLSSTNEYKVVRIYYNKYPDVGKIQMYTLGGGSDNKWRDIGETTFLVYLPGVLAHETLYFTSEEGSYSKILALDLANETFHLVPSPPCIVTGRSAFYQVKVLGGYLCLVHQQYGEQIDIWLLKDSKQNNSKAKAKDYNSWTWNREFSIPLQEESKGEFYEPFALTRSNKILFWYRESTLCSYDPKTGTFKTIVSCDDRFKNFQAIPHMNTLVSLKDLGVKSRRRTKMFKKSTETHNYLT